MTREVDAVRAPALDDGVPPLLEAAPDDAPDAEARHGRLPLDRRRAALTATRALGDALGFGVPLWLCFGAFRLTLIATVLLVLALAQAGLYRSKLHLSALDELPALATQAFAAVGVVGLLLVASPARPVDGGFLLGAVAGTTGLVASRAVLHGVVRQARLRGLVRHPVVLLGGGEVAADLVETLRAHHEYGLEPVGYLDATPSPTYMGRTLPFLGSASDLARVLAEREGAVLLVAFGTARESDLISVLTTRVVGTRSVFVVPRFYEAFGNKYGDHIGAVPVVRRRRPSLRGPASYVKRAFDVVCSGLALLLLSPLLVGCAIAVRLEGGPGIIFRQQRVGQDGQHFELLKFRSLTPVDEHESASTWNVSRDSRLGPVGRVLRRTSLDELPQLWNILRGDMTIVGPRPERPYYVHRFSQDVPRYSHRHRVPVGLTGLAQVSGLRGDTSIRDRARFDNYYIENWSLWLDIKVIVRTAREVLFARGG